MGKRLRSLGIRWKESPDDVRITRHAIKRFQSRVEFVSDSEACRRIRRLLETAQPVMRPTGQKDRLYLDHPVCTLVMTRQGVIVTVYPPGEEEFVESITEVRRFKKRKRP